MPPNYQKPYPPEFRREAVELVQRGGRPVTEIARELGVSGESLSKWLRQAAADAGEHEGLATGERQELRELRRRVRTLKPERRSLKGAYAQEQTGTFKPSERSPSERETPAKCGFSATSRARARPGRDGAYRDRTGDLRLAKPALSQLS